MKMELTDITDIKSETYTESGSRLMLADQIIDEFTPLFSDEIERKRRELNNNLADVKKLKAIITKTKTDLQTVNDLLKIETIKSDVISEIKYLNQYDVLYGRSRQVVKDILSSIEAQTSEDLNENLEVLRRMVRSNVNKVMQ